MSVDLNLLLQFSLIILVIALTVAVVIIVMILFDVRQVTARVKREIMAVTFISDIINLVLGAFGFARKKINATKIVKGIKNTLKIVSEEDD